MIAVTYFAGVTSLFFNADSVGVSCFPVGDLDGGALPDGEVVSVGGGEIDRRTGGGRRRPLGDVLLRDCSLHADRLNPCQLSQPRGSPQIFVKTRSRKYFANSLIPLTKNFAKLGVAAGANLVN